MRATRDARWAARSLPPASRPLSSSSRAEAAADVLLRLAAMSFDRYLRTAHAAAAAPRYSKVV